MSEEVQQVNEERIRKSGGHARGIEDTSVIRMSRAIFCTMDSNLCFTSEPFIIFFLCKKISSAWFHSLGARKTIRLTFEQ